MGVVLSSRTLGQLLNRQNHTLWCHAPVGSHQCDVKPPGIGGKVCIVHLEALCTSSAMMSKYV